METNLLVMPGSNLYIHDKDSEKSVDIAVMQNFLLFVTYKASFKYHTQNDVIKKSRFIQKYITICLVSKMISLHLQHQTHI